MEDEMTAKEAKELLETFDPDRICGAKNRNGNPCGNTPALGFKRCRFHGGAAPKSIEKSRERIRRVAELSLYRMMELVESEDDLRSVTTAFKAAADRAGLHKKKEIDHGGEGFELNIILDEDGEDDVDAE